MMVDDLLDLEATKIAYIAPGLPGLGPKRRVFHLAGPGAGREGVVLGPDPDGDTFAPFGLLTSEGATQDGAEFLRSVRDKRDMDFTIQIGGANEREFMANHDVWWRSLNSDIPGYLARYTKYAGWRMVPVHYSTEAKPVTGIDPVFNCFESYAVHLTAMDPFYRGFDEQVQWTNSQGTNRTVLPVRNAADQRAWPRYTMRGPGRWYIEDPYTVDEETGSGRMIQTPLLLANEELRIDTHQRRPTARLYNTVTGVENQRNVWAQIGGRRWLFPIEPWDTENISVEVEGGNLSSAIIAVSTPRFSRPF